jgi:hypothetical protein
MGVFVRSLGKAGLKNYSAGYCRFQIIRSGNDRYTLPRFGRSGRC